jgi:hypothetical protein
MPGIEPVPSVVVLAGTTMSEQWGMNGAACRVAAQSKSSNCHVGAMRWKCAISLCI